MDIIKTYLENMFNGIKITSEITRVKNDLLISMEDKYNELKLKGKSENEAIGIVISEFGNIDELKRELNIGEDNDTKKSVRVVELAEVKEFLLQKRKNALAIAISVAMIIAGVSFFIFTIMFNSENLNLNVREIVNENIMNDALNKTMIVGLTVLILLVAASVGIIIISNSKLMKFDFLTKKFMLPEHVRQYAENEKNSFLRKYTFYNVIGVILCITSVLLVIIPAFLQNERALVIGLPLMLFVIAIAVIPLIFVGTINEGFLNILKMDLYARNVKSEKIIGAVAGVFWTTITAVYLLVSFLTERWDISWIIWPVSALLFGGFSALIEEIYKKSE